MTNRDTQPPVVEWAKSDELVAYPTAETLMQQRVEDIVAGRSPELIWLLQHPPIYTAGTSAKPDDLLTRQFPVYQTGRGGQLTYHGPGQRIVYCMLDVKRRFGDVRKFVLALENWMIDALADLGISAHTTPNRVGVWVDRPDKGPGREDKIAAIGIRLRRWTSFHGLSINVTPNLAHYAGIVPCGISDQGVTSFADLSVPATMHDLDDALRSVFENKFGPTCLANDPMTGHHEDAQASVLT